MERAKLERTLYWTLRVACFGIFLGHGMFGVLGGKAAWLPYFDVLGIPESLAWPMMRLVGFVDVAAAFVVLFRPVRVALYYMVFWGFWTALLRPLAGEGWWEFLERFPNWIVPLGFLFLHFKQPFIRLKEWSAEASRKALLWCMILGTGVHYVGHGGYGAIMRKDVWYSYFAVFGIDRAAVDAMNLIVRFGWAEIALGLLVIAKPTRVFAAVGIAFMLFDPVARVFAGEPIWEFIERFGNLLSPVALYLMLMPAMRKPAAPPAAAPANA